MTQIEVDGDLPQGVYYGVLYRRDSDDFVCDLNKAIEHLMKKYSFPPDLCMVFSADVEEVKSSMENYYTYKDDTKQYLSAFGVEIRSADCLQENHFWLGRKDMLNGAGGVLAVEVRE